MRFSLNCWNIRQQDKVYSHPVDNFPFHTFERPDVALAGKLILGSFVGEQPFTCKSITVHKTAGATLYLNTSEGNSPSFWVKSRHRNIAGGKNSGSCKDTTSNLTYILFSSLV
jgi:hypothetical protein